MSADVTFSEETFFFPLSMKDFNSVQQVLPVPPLSPSLFPAPEASSQEEN